jgi:NAD(P)H-dependent flavin oxidoreductase YrpB (nitropropane dioxygenase family)
MTTPLPGSPLAGLGVTVPVLAAPMAGGPTTAALVLAAAQAGGMGFLAGGSKSAAELGEQVVAVRSSGVPAFGVNLFVPNPVAVDLAEYRRYADALRPLACRYGVELPKDPVEDDDHWDAKLDLLLSDPVPVVSFTFGIPPGKVFSDLRARGTIVVQTVTNAAEARAATDAGADMLVVQGCAAGGHSATLTPERMPDQVPLAVLLAMVQDATRLPIIAAGGLATPQQAAAVVHSGAKAVMVGTSLLRAPESGASTVHRAAIADHSRGATVMTRCFTGRPARALPNQFVFRYDPAAPVGYPAVHHLTSPIRKAAAAAGDFKAVHLWAGTGYQQATADPAADVLRGMASAL